MQHPEPNKNGKLKFKDPQRTITIQWGVPSLLLLCLAAISITALQLFRPR